MKRYKEARYRNRKESYIPPYRLQYPLLPFLTPLILLTISRKRKGKDQSIEGEEQETGILENRGERYRYVCKGEKRPKKIKTVTRKRKK